MVYLKRKETFCAAHQLYNPAWSEAENKAVFGKCAHPNYHGHNYVLWVTVKGPVNAATGMVMNFTDLKHIMKSEVIEVLDHKNLNVDIPFLQGKRTSAEVLAMEIWAILAPKVSAFGAQLHCVRIDETENNIAEYYGE
jgi:6-pyruvoyltetrahydropterin/6-carboxytetrahydropterin synthase